MDVKHTERELERGRKLFSASRRAIEKVILTPTCLIERLLMGFPCGNRVGLVSIGRGEDYVESNAGFFTRGGRKRRLYR